MPNNSEWYKTIQPLHIKDSAPDTQKICSRAMEQLPLAAERNETMKQKKLSHRFRPLIFAIAALGIGAISLVTANAATDGALFSKMTMYINGKAVETNIRLVEEDKDTITYEVVADDSGNTSDTFQIIGNKDRGVETGGFEEIDDADNSIDKN